MKYVLIALALLVVGSIADVPVVFLASHGSLPILFVVITGFLADILPDFFWYWLGGKIGVEGFAKLPILRQRPEHLERVGHTLDHFGGIVLFSSKFVYWLGIPTQIMAGAHHFPLRRAVVANVLGSLGWLALLFALASVFSIDVIEDYLRDGKVVFTVFVCAAALFYILIGGIIKKFIKE